MLKIRFVRVGRKHDPTYRLVVVDSRRAPRSGACLENLGNYNPTQKTHNLKEESIKKWISKGAQMSDTAHNLLIKTKIIKGKKINVSKTKKKKKGDVVSSEQPDEKPEEKEPVKKEETKEETSDKKDEKKGEPKEDKPKEEPEKQEEKS